MKKVEIDFEAMSYFDIGVELLPRILIGYFHANSISIDLDWLWFGLTIEFNYTKTTKNENKKSKNQRPGRAGN